VRCCGVAQARQEICYGIGQIAHFYFFSLLSFGASLLPGTAADGGSCLD